MGIRIYAVGLPTDDLDWGCEHCLRQSYPLDRKFLAVTAEPEHFTIYQHGLAKAFVVLDLRHFPAYLRLGQIKTVCLCHKCFSKIRELSPRIHTPVYF